jgi:plasmid stabilization system protein ParE
MGCKLIFSPQAIADLESAVRYIAKDNPVAGVRVGNALIARVLVLERFQLIGSQYRKRPGVRKLVSRPYIIFYRPRLADNCVDILRYWHAARGEPEL